MSKKPGFLAFRASLKKPGFCQNLPITTNNCRKNPVSGPPSFLKETGFLPKSTHHNQQLSKKPGFWATLLPQRNRVFGRICASQPTIVEKTRFLGLSRFLKETGFLAASVHHNQQLSKKPGFWPFALPQRNRVFGRICASQPRVDNLSGFRSIRAVGQLIV
ncbi:hypothetical protein [Tychonema sp. LEGE 07203]|uniref:hypothetical protein n=1 Tax=Tychonema sp. LEGE 07203 TaxID=1828671 RepID=UPI001881F3D7|nr:hypothetical protein [Tychonema sp. LEGE 07203]MBE9096130.1 hypothetical protein [Tychonema sp. LEGE 07203]